MTTGPYLVSGNGGEIQPILLAGGSGTRLWPLSRRAFPKQFVPLLGDSSLFQETCQRVKAPAFLSPVVLGSAEHRFLIAEQMLETGIEPGAIILEPSGRDTAAAACIAALKAAKNDARQLVALMPCDHRIFDAAGFRAALMDGVEHARAGSIVVFGIAPTSPHTGYGYIEVGAGEGDAPEAIWKVLRFVEKPDRETAESYLESGNFLWNGGIFLFEAGVMLEAFQRLAPEIHAACSEALDKAQIDLDFIRLDPEAYGRATKISLDYAIMEKLDTLTCVGLGCDWDDCGTWSAVQTIVQQDDAGNACRGDVILEESSGCLAYNTDSDSVLVMLGLDNVLAIATPDAVLLASKDRAGEVKEIVDRLTRSERSEALLHRRVHRPWGWYETLSLRPGYQVKCIMVKPGAKLSLQSHNQRAEHWVVVSGEIEVTRDRDIFNLHANQSTYIPLGAVHRMANKSDGPAYLIEVQSGAYLGEDDIVRYDDVYGRAAAGE